MSAAAFMIAGTLVSTVGAMQEAGAKSSAAKYNAQVAEMQAKSIEASGKLEADKIKRQKGKMMGRQKALYAKAGVLSFLGSPLEVVADTAAQYELDIATSQYNVKVGAQRYRSEAQQSRQMAGQYKRAGYVGAGSTLLTGLGKSVYLMEKD